MKIDMKRKFTKKVISIFMVFLIVFNVNLNFTVSILSNDQFMVWGNVVEADTPATGSAQTGTGFYTYASSFPGPDGNIYNFSDFNTVKIYGRSGNLINSYASGAVLYEPYYSRILPGTVLIHNYGDSILVMYNTYNPTSDNKPNDRQYVIYRWNGNRYIYQSNGYGGCSYTNPMTVTAYGYVYFWSVASISLSYHRFSDMICRNSELTGTNEFYVGKDYLYNFNVSPVICYTNLGYAVNTEYTPTSFPTSLVESEFGIYTKTIDNTTIKYTSKLAHPDGDFYMMSNTGVVYALKNANPYITIISPTQGQSFSNIEEFNSISIQGTVKDNNLGDKNYIQYNIDNGENQYADIVSGESGNDGHDYITSDATQKTFTIAPINISSLVEGNHILNIIAIDNINGLSDIKQILFKVDKSSPTIENPTIISTSSSIDISSSVADAIAGLDAFPYRYAIGTNEPTTWVDSSSFTQAGLIGNEQYAVKFEARDAVGNIASTTGNVYTKAAAPNFGLSGITSYSLNLVTTDNNSATTQYQISVNDGEKYITSEGTLTTSPVWITLPSKNITVTGLNPSTTYTFTAKAKNAEDIETAWSSPVSGTTLIQPPNAPVNMTAVATSSSISVVWDPVASSNGYDIEVDGTIIDNGTFTSYSHTGLTPYTQHTYRVRAKNEGGIGAWSELMSKYTQQDTPNTPFNIDAAATNTSIIVTWQPISGATAYDIEVDGVVVNNSSSTNYVHTGLLSGTMHSYRVRSINSGGKSEWSNEILVSTLTDAPIVPSNITATPGSGQITVAWDSIPGATYEIEVDGNIKDNGTSNSFVHTALLSGSSHSYRVRTNKSGSLSDWSAVVIATIPVEEFGTPKNIKAEATDTTVTISWSPVVDATGYEVEVDGVVLDNSTETACVFNSLIPNTQYTYRVRAKGTDKVSDWSEPIAVTTYALPTPNNIASTATETSISLTWDAITEAASYEVDIDGQLVEVTTNAYTHESLNPNTQHSYRIRAKSASGTSAWSSIINEATISNALNAPTGIIVKSLTNSIQLAWKAIPEADSYEVEIDSTTVQSVTDTTYVNGGLTANTQHSYRVRAIKNTVTGSWSTSITAFTLPDAPVTPTNVAVSSTVSSILLTWDAVENATEYEIEVDGVIINAGSNTKYLHNSLSPESTHTYRVRAKNSITQSPWSELITTNTKASVQTYTLTTENGQVFNLMFTANELVSPTNYTYTITYNTAELEVLDLCALTARIDMNTGNLIGTDIQIVQFTPGTIVFKKMGNSTGQAWTGLINCIKFKGKTDGEAQITYSIQ